MKSGLKTIFFDWDHTLWDHDQNAKASLRELCVETQVLPDLTKDFERFWKCYQTINTQLWEDYQFGRLDASTLRQTRFVKVFDAMQLSGPADYFSEEFLIRTPKKTALMPGAAALIQALAKQYPLYILTNGFHEVQVTKVESSGLASFFQGLFTSETMKSKKPQAAFFEQALVQAQVEAHEALMVGDHYEIDVLGAEAAGISSIHFCPDPSLPSPHTRNIQTLSELWEFLPA